jgi:hypothetical protein
MRRVRTRLVIAAAAIVLLWLGMVLPHLLDAWARVLVFVGIVVVAAWGFGRETRASAADAAAAAPVEAVADATGLPVDAAAEHKLAE